MLPNDLLHIIYDYSCFSDKENVKNGLCISNDDIINRITQYGIPLTQLLSYVQNEHEKKQCLIKFEGTLALAIWNLMIVHEIRTYSFNFDDTKMRLDVYLSDHKADKNGNMLQIMEPFIKCLKLFGYSNVTSFPNPRVLKINMQEKEAQIFMDDMEKLLVINNVYPEVKLDKREFIQIRDFDFPFNKNGRYKCT